MLDLSDQTWDGEPVSPIPPFGATVVVSWEDADEVRFLMLHRAHQGPDFAGDWAWGPPSGARHPDEPIERCAERELLEETGLQIPLTLTSAGSADWVVYRASVDAATEIQLSAEHDRYAWLPLPEAARLAGPAIVRDQLLKADGDLAEAAPGMAPTSDPS